MKSRIHCLSFAVVALIAVGLAGCDRVQSFLVERAASRGLAGDRNELLDDGNLHVVLCGTGSPVADADRAGPCTAVLAAGHFFLVDVGPGSVRNVALYRLPRARLQGILLTHFHSDHIGELGEATVQSWISGRTAPLPVYGPPGVQQVVDGFRQAYALDTGYRVTHHGVEAMPPTGAQTEAITVNLPGPTGETPVFEGDGLRVTAFAVDHAPVGPAYGYRFDFRGRSVVISGDTKKSDNLIQHAKDADILISEGLATNIIGRVSEYARMHDMTRWAKLTSDIMGYHTTPVQGAEEAKAANVRMLVFTHIVPPLQNFVARRMFLSGVSDVFGGRVEIGKDGMELSLPPNSTSIEVGAV